jgi:hypothetical protein
MSFDEATINDLKKLKEELESNLIHQQQTEQDPTQTEKGE